MNEGKDTARAQVKHDGFTVADAIVSDRAFWLDLTARVDSIISNGEHYVAHELGGGGFNGRAFRVDWIDTSRSPLICNLSGQGKIPVWLRPKLPDNANITSLDYMLDVRPVISRRRVRRYLMNSGLLPSEANEFLRNRDADRNYSHFDNWPSQALRDLLKHGKRHANKWFPSDIAIADDLR